MSESQKALSCIVKAVSQMQDQVSSFPHLIKYNTTPYIYENQMVLLI